MVSNVLNIKNSLTPDFDVNIHIFNNFLYSKLCAVSSRLFNPKYFISKGFLGDYVLENDTFVHNNFVRLKPYVSLKDGVVFMLRTQNTLNKFNLDYKFGRKLGLIYKNDMESGIKLIDMDKYLKENRYENNFCYFVKSEVLGPNDFGIMEYSIDNEGFIFKGTLNLDDLVDGDVSGLENLKD